jgi:regulator of Ty1 transposition protein 103
LVHGPSSVETLTKFEFISLLSLSLDKAAAEAFAEKVEEASKVIAEYNKRLESELKERRELQELLAAFIYQQKRLLKEAKKNLKEFQSKQERVTAVKEELKSHLANLPDLSRLPMGSKTSLTPLPSVGDLFT